MKVGIFTDSYIPSINGITYVTESLKRNLEELGHEVYIFCPAKSLRPSYVADVFGDDDHIIRFPSVQSRFFEDFDLSLFFPPQVERKIRSLNLDIVHVMTLSQVGLMGMRVAHATKIPYIIQHCTDMYEFVEHYPHVLPGSLALVSLLMPFSVRLHGRDIKELIKLYKPRGPVAWNRVIIRKATTILYSKAADVIVLCQKSYDQLESWQYGKYSYDLTLLPNGVNAIPRPSKSRLMEFRSRYGIDESDEVFGYVGRLAAEKNLPIMIEAFERIAKKRPKAKLLFVGDFDYRPVLESLASKSNYADRIIFTGAMPRQELGVAYATLDVFVFTSLKDTQGWVLHEAAHAGLPIVVIDIEVSEVVKNNINGLHAKNSSVDLANKITKLLNDPELRKKFGEQSKKLAQKFTEKKQIRKLEKAYVKAIVVNQRNRL